MTSYGAGHAAVLFLGDVGIPAAELLAVFRDRGFTGGAVVHDWRVSGNDEMVRINRAFESRVPTGLVDGGELRELVAGVREHITGVVTQFFPVSRDLLDELPALTFVATVRSGTQNIDTAAAAERNITVRNNPGRNAPVVADFAVAMMMAASRGIATAHTALAAGTWLPRPDRKAFRTLGSSAVGLVGFGQIGGLVARLLRGFDCPVRVYDPYLPAAALSGTQVVRVLSLEELMAGSDVVSLHAKVTPETTGLIDAPALDLLGPNGILVNTARAELVDEAALVAALREHRIGGAALDVFSEEPLPAGHPLRALAHVTLTPHLAGSSRDAATTAVRLLADRLRTAGPTELFVPGTVAGQ